MVYVFLPGVVIDVGQPTNKKHQVASGFFATWSIHHFFLSIHSFWLKKNYITASKKKKHQPTKHLGTMEMFYKLLHHVAFHVLCHPYEPRTNFTEFKPTPFYPLRSQPRVDRKMCEVTDPSIRLHCCATGLWLRCWNSIFHGGLCWRIIGEVLVGIPLSLWAFNMWFSEEWCSCHWDINEFAVS